MQIRRKFEEALSSGQGAQIKWLAAIILVIVVILFILGVLSFGKENFDFWELMALFLDPGNVKQDGASLLYSIFRLLSTCLGIFLLSALLISVVSNMFQNIADSNRDGRSRYTHDGHVLIIGAGHQLHGILSALADPQCGYLWTEAVVVTESEVSEVRNSVLERFDKKLYASFLSKIVFYSGSRVSADTLGNLCADKATRIYIIGEDQESNHDQKNITCCDMLKPLCVGKDPHTDVFLVLNDAASVEIYKYSGIKGDQFFNVDVIDENSYMICDVLTHNQIASNEGLYPAIDYRDVEFVDGVKPKQVVGILPDTDKYLHIVISGMTAMGKSVAMNIANICHFPNFTPDRRTRITFVAEDIEGMMEEYISCHENLFELSHYSYVSFDSEGGEIVKRFAPDPRFGDFLDIEWEFVEGRLTDAPVKSLLRKWSQDEKQSVSIFVCQEDQQSNVSTALSLPKIVYTKAVPVFVYQNTDGSMVTKARETGMFGLIYAFGMSTAIPGDALFENNPAKRINFMYECQYNPDFKGTADEAWWSTKISNKLSSVFSASAVYTKIHSFDLNSLKAAAESLSEIEHRRWMMADLFLGFRAMPAAQRDDLIARLNSDDEQVRDAAKSQKNHFKNDLFVHIDIVDYSKMPAGEAEKDMLIVENIPYIIGLVDKPKF